MDEDPPKRVDDDEWSAIVGVGAQRAQTALWCKELGAHLHRQRRVAEQCRELGVALAFTTSCSMPREASTAPKIATIGTNSDNLQLRKSNHV